jgi:hypothetical protein
MPSRRCLVGTGYHLLHSGNHEQILHFSDLYGIIEMLGLNKKEYFDHNVSNENIIVSIHRRFLLYSYQLLLDISDIP